MLAPVEPRSETFCVTRADVAIRTLCAARPTITTQPPGLTIDTAASAVACAPTKSSTTSSVSAANASSPTAQSTAPRALARSNLAVSTSTPKTLAPRSADTATPLRPSPPRPMTATVWDADTLPSATTAW
ncbi:hypothetical protein CH063_09525 [Colletotrichum higginsianum]|uniref:Uncharacterized protein n=1 Tax=Colletotrichum higginsianum (strain IMI 349063) TaxID=759273 RepID=H1VDY0_COLHI|nr:hypothetical protein CH063_09525 [Colletotrichum higginsianum]